MTVADQMVIRSLLHKRIRVGRLEGVGPIYILSEYDSTKREFTTIHDNGKRSSIDARQLLRAKAAGIIHVL